MSVSKASTDLFFSLESDLHRPDVRSSRRRVAELLADGFIEFGSSGRVYDKATIIAALACEASSGSAAPPQVSEFVVRAISEDAFLITYKSSRSAAAMEKARQTLRSSIWKMIEGRWQMVFHQGTIIPEA